MVFVSGVAVFAAAVVAFIEWSPAVCAAWQTAIPPQVHRTLTLEQAREQYEHGMAIAMASGIVAVVLSSCSFTSSGVMSGRPRGSSSRTTPPRSRRAPAPDPHAFSAW